MTVDQYNWFLTTFFTYVAFEVPSNLAIKGLRPSRWLSAIMVAWGVAMTLMGLFLKLSRPAHCSNLLGRN